MERFSLQNMPGLYKVMSGVEQYVNQCGLDMKLLELMRYRISQINHCAYCLDMHFKEAVHHGETSLRLYSVSAWHEAPFYTNKEKLVFEFAVDHHTLQLYWSGGLVPCVKQCWLIQARIKKNH